MTTPVLEISCDRPGCTEKIRRSTWFNEWWLRTVASQAGWQVRPARGRGSRTAPDLCPGHRTTPV